VRLFHTPSPANKQQYYKETKNNQIRNNNNKQTNKQTNKRTKQPVQKTTTTTTNKQTNKNNQFRKQQQQTTIHTWNNLMNSGGSWYCFASLAMAFLCDSFHTTSM
jgi:hypothetical protein